MNGLGSYAVAGTVVAGCAALAIWWTPANSSHTPDFPATNNFFPETPTDVLIPPRDLPTPGGSPLPSQEGNMPSRAPGELPGLNTPPRSNVPAPRTNVPSGPSVVPPVPTGPAFTPPPPPFPDPTVNPCPIGLRLDPLLGVCIRL